MTLVFSIAAYSGHWRSILGEEPHALRGCRSEWVFHSLRRLARWILTDTIVAFQDGWS